MGLREKISIKIYKILNYSQFLNWHFLKVYHIIVWIITFLTDKFSMIFHLSGIKGRIEFYFLINIVAYNKDYCV